MLFFSNLAVGIGIQNFPEGLAVSLPLKAAGMSKLKSFWSVFLSLQNVDQNHAPYIDITCRYGQLSGMVEPFAGIFGTLMIAVSPVIIAYTVMYLNISFYIHFTDC